MAKQHKINTTEVKTEHNIPAEYIVLDPENYRSEEIGCKIFEQMEKIKHNGSLVDFEKPHLVKKILKWLKLNLGNKFEKYPMVCDLKSKDNVFLNETLSFISNYSNFMKRDLLKIISFIFNLIRASNCHKITSQWSIIHQERHWFT